MLDEFYLGIDYGHKKTGLAIAQNIIKKSRPLKESNRAERTNVNIYKKKKLITDS